MLIIDDNNGMRAYLRSILNTKYNVSEAADGQQGLERARREVPKIVVCDVMMPVMDGLEFTRRLKQDTATSHIPVILLTARSLTEQRAEGYDCGADSYITKPFSGSVLLARIDNLLRSRAMLRSIFSGNTQKEEAEKMTLGTQDKSFVSHARHHTAQHGRLRILGGTSWHRDRALACAALSQGEGIDRTDTCRAAEKGTP